jgi:hypothetical protein
MTGIVIPDGGTIGSTSDTDAISIASNGQVTFSSNTLATQSEVFGTQTNGSITNGTTALTVASASGISNGDFVVGQGITPGTTVSSGGGTTSITLSANANATLSSDPVTFYSATKLLSPGLVGGMLCKAWAQFTITGTIESAYNVSSVEDTSSTVKKINFTTAMTDEFYACALTQINISDSAYYTNFQKKDESTSSQLQTYIESESNTYGYTIAVFR